MRKHFLLLFLMALLPLAGWAQTDLSDGWSITFDPAGPVTYTGEDQTPAVKLEKTASPDLTTGFNVAWSSAEIINAGSYTVTVTADNTNTYDDLATPTKKFWILKANAQEKTGTTLWAGGAYDGNSHALITTPPTFNLNSNADFAGITPLYSVDGTTWSEEIPTAKKPGTYNVYYKVEGNDNYNGIASVHVGDVTITGNALVEITDYTAPQLVAGDLSFQWDAVNNKPVEQTLITAGTTPTNHGTLYYCVDGGEWSTELPTASTAGDHVVSWKVVGDEGYYDVAPANLAAKHIAAVAPTVTAATGATSSLVWTGEAQDLLSEAGSATLGATSKVVYTVQYKAALADAWSAEGAEIDNFENVEGTDAGYYQINTKVLAAGNYLAAAADPITVQIAGAAAFTAAPTAKSLTWTGAAQQLIEAGAGTVAGKVQYSVDGGAYSTAIPQGTDAKDYTVKYKVVDPNYADYNVEKTIAGVKINKAFLTIKVKDVTKTYDATTDIPAITAGNIAEKLQFITTVPGYVTTGVAYVVIPAGDENINKKVGTKKGVVTISKDAFIALDAVNANYDVSIVPGDLIVNEAELYVTANDQAALTTNMSAIGVYDLANQYVVYGLAGGETKADAFETAPVLTASDAPATIVPGQYTLAFTQGTLKAGGNYKMRAENPYVIAAGEKFIVNPAAGTKVVITVLPHSKKYGAADPDYSKWVEGTDYFVSGLAAGDELQDLTFSRDGGETVAGGPYALRVSASVKNPGWYDEPVAFNNSTFTIETVELTATVNQQTVAKDALKKELDQEAWTVTGLVGDDANSDDLVTLLGADLDFNTTEGDVADRADVTTPGTYNKGIMLTITNTNYTLKASSIFGKLLVIANDQFALNPNDANLVSKLEVADGKSYQIVFSEKEMNIGEWYAMVLPFDVDPLKMVSAFNRYVIFNELNTKGTTNKNFKFTLTMNTIPAGTPFLIKFAPRTGDAANAVVNWATDFTSATYGDVEISKDIQEVDATYVIFTGIYEQKTMQNQKNGANTADIQDNVWWLANTNYKGDNEWKKPTNSVHTTAAMEAYLKATALFDDATYAPIITVEDFDGQTTAIKSLSADEIHGLNVKGMYNLNGMKMNNVPTQKGVYIVNGKKVVIK